jgi:amino acid transporter
MAVALITIAAIVARSNGTAVEPALVEGSLAGMAGALGIMCFAFIGVELAPTMVDEIRHPARDLPRAIVLIGAIALVSYVVVTDALLALVPSSELGAIQGVMQAVSRGAATAGVGWITAPIAVVLAVAAAGAASAWFAGPARIPFVAGLDHVLPAALGRVHPRWGSPYVALLVCALISAAFTALSLAGSTVAEAYQVLLRAAVVINLVPFVYIFLALIGLDTARPAERLAGGTGALVTIAGIVAAFAPGDDVSSPAVFGLKMAAGVAAPIGVGVWLYWRSRSRTDFARA